MTVSTKFQHFILTKYMARFSNDERSTQWLSNMDDERFEQRLSVFVQNCLPSVASQTNQGFRWLIWFDPIVNPRFVDRVRDIVSPHENFEVVVDDCEISDVKRNIVSRLDANSEWILTSRLDNDDSIADHYIATLQNSVELTRRHCLNFPVGLISYDDKIYLYRHSSNNVISIVEPVNEFSSIWIAPHNLIGALAPIVQLDHRPAFVQVVHGENVSNKPRGVRIPKLLAAHGFPATPHYFRGMDTETDLEVLADALTSAPLWMLRDRLAHIGRRLIPGFRVNRIR